MKDLVIVCPTLESLGQAVADAYTKDRLTPKGRVEIECNFEYNENKDAPMFNYSQDMEYNQKFLDRLAEAEKFFRDNIPISAKG